MTQRYLGGIITANPTEPSSNLSNASASGMWTLQEALSFYRAGDWPNPTNTPSTMLFGGGNASDFSNVIDKIIPESTGNATDFGDLTSARKQLSSFGSDVRAVWAGGEASGGRGNVLDFVTYSTSGNATDFGNLNNNLSMVTGTSNNVRGLSAGGYVSDKIDVIDFVTIPTAGNAVDFGNLTAAKLDMAGLASTTRAVFSGGQ